MAPRRFIPALLRRSSAPIQSSRSGLTGFFTKTGISTPLRESAISCMAKGLAEVRAPIQRISMPAFKAASTCALFATSVATSIPHSFCTRCIHGSPSSPIPSKLPGLVRGFHIPARNIFTPILLSCCAVVMTCSSVSALQGPAITRGRLSSTPGRLSFSNLSSIVIYLIISCFLFFREPL